MINFIYNNFFYYISIKVSLYILILLIFGGYFKMYPIFLTNKRNKKKVSQYVNKLFNDVIKILYFIYTVVFKKYIFNPTQIQM